MFWLLEWHHRWGRSFDVGKWTWVVFYGTINLPLDVMDALVVNTIQIERTIDITNFAIEPILIHEGTAKINFW